MPNLTAGNVIVARYELSEQVTIADTDTKMWHAKDKIFNREVNLFSVGDLDPEVAKGALERARQTAQVTVAGIARVLDVLESGPTRVIVTERPSGVNALTAISEATFLVAQAHAVIGEVASRLEKAAEKSLHHGNLGPDSIWFDGNKITLDGLVARHILNSNDGLSTQELAQRDVLGLSALLYFMLTGLMPQYQGVDNDLPRLLTVIAHMTPELEKLSTGVLNGSHPAPESITDFLTQLGPWSPDDLPVIDPAILAGIEVQEDEEPAIPAPPVQRASIRSVLGPQAPGGTVPPAPPTVTAAVPVGAPQPPSIPATQVSRPTFGALAPTGGVPPKPAVPPASTAGADSRSMRFNPTAIILILALGALVWGGTWAYQTLTAGFEPIMVSPTGRPTPAETEGENGSKEPTKEPEKIILPVIASAKSLDPQGDENEHPELQDKLIDGDSASVWYSRTYRTQAFSNLKTGIGIALTLEQESTVTSVLISGESKGGMVEVRATSADKPTEGEVLASGPLDGETLFTLSKPTKADSIVLWFTELPKDHTGKNRFYIYEISLT